MNMVSMLLFGSFLFPQQTVYRWQSYSVRGDALYVVKTVSINAINIPIPERGATKVLEKNYQVVAIDLAGKEKKPAKISHRLYPKRPLGRNHLADAFGYYEYIEINDDGAPILWGRSELKGRLMQADGVGCVESEVGDVIYDSQDSRVLYLYCKRKDTVYRMEFPWRRAVAIPLGKAAGLLPSSGLGFFSTVGQKKIFFDADDAVYEIEIGSRGQAKRIGKIESNMVGPEERSAKSLIGIAEGLRIYQLTQIRERTAQLLVESETHVARIFPLPTALVTSVVTDAVYLPRNNLVMWEVLGEKGEISGKSVIYTIKLDSGAVSRAVVTVAE